MVSNDQKENVVDDVAHQNLFEGADFSLGFVVRIAARRRPDRRPGVNAALASHQGMIAQLHDFE